MYGVKASISVILRYIYETFNLSPLTKTGIIILYTDHSFVYPISVLENVLLQVKGLVFPVDFYIFYKKNDKSPNSSPILLGQLIST
jgi:hypothetical protein